MPSQDQRLTPPKWATHQCTNDGTYYQLHDNRFYDEWGYLAAVCKLCDKPVRNYAEPVIEPKKKLGYN